LSPTGTSTFTLLNTVVSDNSGVGIFILPTATGAVNGVISGVTKGAQPSHVEQASRYGLVINLKTASALGLTVPLQSSHDSTMCL
jgi:hypothetical protein